MWMGEGGNEIRYTVLEGIRIWLWDIQSRRRQCRGEDNNNNAILEHRDGIREGDKVMGIWYQ